MYIFLIVNAAHNEASLMKLSKEELVRIALDYYQGKFNGVLDDLNKNIFDLKNDLSGLKSNFSKLEAIIQVTKNYLKYLKDSWQWKEGATLTDSLKKFQVYVQELLIILFWIKRFGNLEKIDVPIDPSLFEGLPLFIFQRLVKESHKIIKSS